ncbi:hypothetical protein F8M41_022704 [Gigaspora margarita]|uniref:Peptidase S1 domain-containing protein n=1 Tax=Gigaspora margarita TaxID=4874 RepID=A0A8H4AEN8_GIGMA|nr:hypothetical protein F8M41_022704 [Gigaspora margarita]
MVHSQEGSKEPLAKLWNIDNDEIPEYLNIERKLIMVDGILRSLLDNDNFSGTRIDVIRNKRFINTLNFTRADEIKNLTQINQYIDLLEFVKAFYSTTKLKSNLGGILKLTDVYNAAAIGYIDVEFNNIVITSCLGDRSRNNGFLTAIKIYEPYPRLSFYDCGAGINNTSSNDMEPKVVVKQVVKEILAGDGIYSPSEINGSIAVSSIGAHLCHSGLTTNVKCGYVKSLNRDGFFRNPTHFSDDISFTDAWSRRGDSGGPVFYYKDLMNVRLNGILATVIGDQISGIFVAVPLSSILKTININVVTT